MTWQRRRAKEKASSLRRHRKADECLSSGLHRVESKGKSQRMMTKRGDAIGLGDLGAGVGEVMFGPCCALHIQYC